MTISQSSYAISRLARPGGPYRRNDRFVRKISESNQPENDTTFSLSWGNG
jgi:hypothetical protein